MIENSNVSTVTAPSMHQATTHGQMPVQWLTTTREVLQPSALTPLHVDSTHTPMESVLLPFNEKTMLERASSGSDTTNEVTPTSKNHHDTTVADRTFSMALAIYSASTLTDRIFTETATTSQGIYVVTVGLLYMSK